MAANVTEVTDANFDRDVLQADVPVLVDFWAPWCGPCRAIAPTVEQLSVEHAGKVKFVKLNVDDNPRVASRYDIRSIPTLLLFRGGQVVGVQVGAVGKAKLEELVRKGIAG